MNTVSPIRDKKQIEILKIYLKSKSIRDYLLLIMGLNTNLRISDLIIIKVEDVWTTKKCKEYIHFERKENRKT